MSATDIALMHANWHWMAFMHVIMHATNPFVSLSLSRSGIGVCWVLPERNHKTIDATATKLEVN